MKASFEFITALPLTSGDNTFNKLLSELIYQSRQVSREAPDSEIVEGRESLALQVKTEILRRFEDLELRVKNAEQYVEFHAEL